VGQRERERERDTKDRKGNLLPRFTEQGQSTVPKIMLSDIPQEIFKEVEKNVRQPGHKSQGKVRLSEQQFTIPVS
jgi:hypothetical protein